MRAGLIASLAFLTAGCALHAPRPETPVSLSPMPQGNAPTSPINPASGPAQFVVLGAPVQTDWWTAFGNATLNDLVTRALKSGNDIASAEASLRQAQELARVAGATALPGVDVGYTVQRARVSNEVATPLFDPNNTLYTLHTTQVTVNYPIDVFGGVRSRIRSSRTAAEAQGYRAYAARTTLVSNLVLAVVQHASLAAQIDAADASVRANRDILTMIRRRQVLGSVGLVDVAAQETALAAAETVAPPLRRNLLHQEALIATYMGQAPGSPLPALPRLVDLTLPATLPLAVPSDLVRQRPDVQAAGAAMRGAAFDVRTAIAARLPAITLSGNAGGSATEFTRMFTPGDLFYSIVGGIIQPVFHGGALKHQQRANEAALDIAKAQYRATVLQSFVDVADALAALHSDADALDAATRGAAASATNYRFVRRQLDLGDVGTLTLLNATSARAQAQAALVQTQAARLSDTVALFQAIGGGFTTDSRGS